MHLSSVSDVYFYIFCDVDVQEFPTIRPDEKSANNLTNNTDNTPIYSSVKKNKVSTGVGPTRSVADGCVQTYDTITNVKSEINKSDSGRKSTGTSPPPQNMSTQVSSEEVG